MKVLTFVMAMLMLLAVVSYARLHQAIDHQHLTYAQNNHMQAQRDLQNNYQKLLYRLATTGMHDQFKINLWLARDEDGVHRQLAENLMRNLFPDVADKVPELLKRLADEIGDKDHPARQAQSSPNPHALATVEMGDLQETWISMLEGRGFAHSLLEHFTLDHRNEDPHIYIAFAKPEVIEVVFSQESAAEEFAETIRQLIEEFEDELRTLSNNMPTHVSTAAEAPSKDEERSVRHHFKEELEARLTDIRISSLIDLNYRNIISCEFSLQPSVIVISGTAGESGRLILKRYWPLPEPGFNSSTVSAKHDPTSTISR